MTEASAKITITLEVDVGGGAWGHDCTVGQVHKQALDGARNRLGLLLQKEPGIRVIGEMQVLMITFPLGRK